MSSIQQILASILNAVYGKDVRQAIHDGVEMAYNKADDAATSAAAAAEAASGSQESAAASAQAASNSASSASDFADAAEQYKNEAFHTTPAGYEAFVGEVNSSLAYCVENGVKNILKIDAVSESASNVDITINDDGTVTLDGNSTGANGLTLGTLQFFESTMLKLSGCPSGGSQNSYYLRIFKAESPYTVYIVDTGNGGEGTIPANTLVKVQVAFGSGVNMDNVLFKPMVTFSYIPDSDYAHFVKGADSNAVLTEKNKWKLFLNGNQEHFVLNENSSIDVSALEWEEIIVAIQVSTSQWVNIPIAKEFNRGSFLGGYYYSSQYNASICIKLESNVISINSGWTALLPAFGQSASGEYNARVYYR